MNSVNESEFTYLRVLFPDMPDGANFDVKMFISTFAAVMPSVEVADITRRPTAAEAIYSFIAWMSSLKHPQINWEHTYNGKKLEWYVTRFLDANKLPLPRGATYWPSNIVMPDRKDIESKKDELQVRLTDAATAINTDLRGLFSLIQEYNEAEE